MSERMIRKLRTEAMECPIGIDTPAPAFSWQITGVKPDVVMETYRILVTNDNDVLFWDSGHVRGSQSTAVLYEGRPLTARTRYIWRVTCTDSDGNVYPEAQSFFETGLMSTGADAWGGARFIGRPQRTVNPGAMTAYRIAVRFSVPSDSRAGIVVAGRNRDNYILFDVDPHKRLLTVFACSDNSREGAMADGFLPTRTVLGRPEGFPIGRDAIASGDEDRFHHLIITVEKQKVHVTINGKTIIPPTEDFLPAEKFFQPRHNTLMQFGLYQPDTTAYYSHICISDLGRSLILVEEDFTDNGGILSGLGTVENGVLTVEDRFDLVSPVPALCVLGGFSVNKPVASARLYATARGFYEVSINGQRIDEAFFHPGFTDYRLRLGYKTYDVTRFLRQGGNRIYAVVGKGYYTGYLGYCGPEIYGTEESFLARLDVTYTDGSTQMLITDGSWICAIRNPVQESDVLDGEIYDARLEPDWMANNPFDDPCWKPVRLMPWPALPVPTNGFFSEPVPFMLSPEGPAAVCERVIRPTAVSECPIGHYIYDFGQNLVGTVRLQVKAPRGTAFCLRYGEMCYPNGELYTINLRSAAVTDIYVAKGKDIETFVPSLTFHGFRYVEITGDGFLLPDDSPIVSLEAIVITNTPEVTGAFSCSDSLVNRLQSNIQWGQRGNSLLVFTDCPQRNERMGWTGDAQVFVPTAAFNMDIRAFMRKWLTDLRDAQLMYNRGGAVPDTAPLGGDNRKSACAGWDDAMTIIPWEMYKTSGDLRYLSENYDAVRRFILWQNSPDRRNFGLRTVDNRPERTQSDLAGIPWIQVQPPRGDHLTFDESTPFILTATAYAAHSADLAARMAELLGHDKDAKLFNSFAKNIRQAFREAWVCPDGSLAYWGEMSKTLPQTDGTVIAKTRYSEEAPKGKRPSQTAYAVAIAFHMMPEQTMDQTAQFFARTIEDRDTHLSVGFLGIGHLLPSLTAVGRIDLAYRLLLQQGHPGWLYSVVNGATTIWERWNSYIAETGTFGDASMNSFNHYAYGSVGAWLAQTVLGINTGDLPGEAGYRRIYLTPTPGPGLSHAVGCFDSPYGRIESGWEARPGYIQFSGCIPCGTTALLTLPDGSRHELSGGRYEFRVAAP